MSGNSIAYSELVTNRDRLRAELEKAEATLFVAAHNFAAEIDGDEDPRVVAARISCRRIRAEFDRLERLVEQTTPPGRIESLHAELLGLRLDEIRKSPPPKTPDAHADADAPLGTASAVLPAREIRVGKAGLAVGRLRALVSQHQHSIRQSLGLLMLVVAYLAYYWIDVQLTIMKLPSVFWNPELSQVSIGIIRLV